MWSFSDPTCRSSFASSSSDELRSSSCTTASQYMLRMARPSCEDRCWLWGTPSSVGQEPPNHPEPTQLPVLLTGHQGLVPHLGTRSGTENKLSHNPYGITPRLGWKGPHSPTVATGWLPTGSGCPGPIRSLEHLQGWGTHRLLSEGFPPSILHVSLTLRALNTNPHPDAP